MTEGLLIKDHLNFILRPSIKDSRQWWENGSAREDIRVRRIVPGEERDMEYWVYHQGWRQFKFIRNLRHNLNNFVGSQRSVEQFGGWLFSIGSKLDISC